MKKVMLLVSGAFFGTVPAIAQAHEEPSSAPAGESSGEAHPEPELLPHTEEAISGSNLESLINTVSLDAALIGGAALIVLTVLAMVFRHRKSLKAPLYWSIVFVTLTTTGILAGGTVYLNTISSSGGPVHWHADFEIWACGTEIELRDPEGALSNKVGTSTFHEHDDKRIHVEGVVVRPSDVNFGNFLQAVGITLTPRILEIPTNQGMTRYESSLGCPDGPAVPQVFLYQVHPDGTFSQRKPREALSYVITPESAVPPGDCLIVEFDQPKDRTDTLCESYRVALEVGKLKGERRGD